MSWVGNSLKGVLSGIEKSLESGELVVFCGAGVSFDSGMPLADDIVHHVVSQINLSENEDSIIKTSELPFESFMETVAEQSYISDLLDIFRGGVPNANHLLLAHLTKQGYLKTICTTNFDLLIEHAFNNVGMIYGKDYHVLCSEKQFETVNLVDNKIRIIKIHGSIDDPESMAITLQYVASRVRSLSRERILRYIFSEGLHKKVLVLGYSCSDIFDISICIERIDEKYKDIIFIDHRSTGVNINNGVGTIEDIEVKNSNNPFRKFNGSKRIYCDTAYIVHRVWEKFVGCGYKNVATTKNDISLDECVSAWVKTNRNNVANVFLYALAASLFFKLSYYSKVIEFCDKGLDAARVSNNLGAEGMFIGRKASAYKYLGEYEKSMEFHNKSLEISKKICHFNLEINNLIDMGALCQFLGKYDEAIDYNRKILNVVGKSEDKRMMAKALGNIGIAYCGQKKYAQGLGCFNQALDIAREIGDKNLEATNLGNIGQVCTLEELFNKANEYIRESIRVSMEIGNKQREAAGLLYLGDLHINVNRIKEAIRYYRNALSITNEIRSEQLREAVVDKLNYANKLMKDSGYSCL